ncbi:MAG: NADH-quinone oxidoreductase subunit C [Acidilobaceae archaeon]
MVEALSLDNIINSIKLNLEGLVKSISISKGYIEVVVDASHIVEAALKLKSMGYDHVKSITAIDYPKESKIRVVYHASSYINEDLAKTIIGLTADIPRDNPVIDSLSQVWRSVEFQEREVYEFFGVIFREHPDLRPLLIIPELAEKKVLRKDFIVKEESIYEGIPHKY